MRWAGEVPLETLDLQGLERAQQLRALRESAQRLQGSLDLGAGPLLRAGLFELGGQEQRLLLIIQHLVVDGVSWGILLEDLVSAYEQLERGEGVRLAAKTSSFKSWSEQLHRYAHSEVLQEQLSYWSALELAQTARLPPDHEESANTVGDERVVRVQLSEPQTQALLREVPEVYHTQINDVLLTGLAQALRDWTGAGRQLIGLEGHGREELFAGVDVSRTVGWFTSLFPVVLDLEGHTGAGAALQAVKEQLRAIPQRGVGYGILRYVRGSEVLRGQPQPQLAFNYLGQLERTLSVGGLLERAPEGVGAARSAQGLRRHLLEVNGGVQEGRLQFTWSYSAGVYERATIEAVAQGFVQRLEELIAHCRVSEWGYTPSDFPLVRLSQGQLDRVIQESGGARAVQDVYPASPLQQGMLFHSLYEPDSTVYVVSLGWRLEGELDEAAFEGAWGEVVGRHELLRTGFVGQELEVPLQVVQRQVQLPFERQDWRGLGNAQQEERFEALFRADRERGFDFARPPLMRVTLIRTQEQEHRVIWSHHHALLDGWSVPLLVNEVLGCYRALRAGERPQLGVVRPYREYLGWLQGQDLGKAQAYWRQRLAGLEGPTPLGIDRGGRSERGGARQQADYRRVLGLELSRVEEFARQQQVTVNTLALGAWGLLLSAYSGSGDVVFGVTVSGRPTELLEAERRVGLFINTLPLRVRVRAQETVGELLQELQRRQGELLEYQYSALVDVQRWSGLSGQGGLFESGFVFENYPVEGTAVRALHGSLRIAGTGSVERPHYPLVLQVAARGSLTLNVIYDTERFERETIERLAEHFERVLAGIVADAQRRCGEVSLLSEAQRQQLLVEWNATQTEYPRQHTLAELFAAQAARTPEAVALVYEEEQIRYGELERRANQLAHHLRGLGVGPEVIVGVCLERSVELVVGCWGF